MKINWKVRFQNKVWLMSFISLIIGFIYNMLKLFDVVPAVAQGLITDMIGQFLTFLGLFGVIVDPTTVGINDSDRAMHYAEPWDDKLYSDDPNEQAEN